MLLSRKPSLTENHGCTFEAVQFWKEVFPLVTGQGDTLHNGKKGIILQQTSTCQGVDNVPRQCHHLAL